MKTIWKVALLPLLAAALFLLPLPALAAEMGESVTVELPDAGEGVFSPGTGESAAPNTGESAGNATGEGVPAYGEEDGTDSRTESADASTAELLMDYFLSHLPGIITALTALYAFFPRVGGIAALVRALSGIKTYFDDESNKQSVYNVLSGSADAVSTFMNDVYPLLKRLEEECEALPQIGAYLTEKKEEAERLRAFLSLSVRATALMAKQFNDLISVSTTLTQKQKAAFEAEWLRENTALFAALSEWGIDGKERVSGDDGEKEVPFT